MQYGPKKKLLPGWLSRDPAFLISYIRFEYWLLPVSFIYWVSKQMILCVYVCALEQTLRRLGISIIFTCDITCTTAYDYLHAFPVPQPLLSPVSSPTLIQQPTSHLPTNFMDRFLPLIILYIIYISILPNRGQVDVMVCLPARCPYQAYRKCLRGTSTFDLVLRGPCCGASGPRWTPLTARRRYMWLRLTITCIIRTNDSEYMWYASW